jgi:hypothetical protein
MKENRKLRHRYLQLWPFNFRQRSPKYTLKKRHPLCKWCRKDWITTCRRMKLDPCLSLCTIINSNWIKHLNVKLWSYDRKRKGKTLKHVGIGINFLNRTPIAQQIRERIDIWDYMKQKSFCTAKDKVIRLKTQLTEWEKIFASYTSDKEVITRI